MLFATIRYASVALAASLAWGQTGTPQSRVFTLANGETEPQLQDIASAITHVGGIRQTQVDASEHAISVSGTADQIEFAQWIVSELDKPAAEPLPANSVEHQYRMPAERFDIVRVFYVAHSQTPLDLQEIMTMMRVSSNLRFIIPNASRRALIARGTALQIEVAAWLVGELEATANAAPSAAKEPHEYKVPGGDELVRLFFLAQSQTPQDIQKVMTTVHAAANIANIFPSVSRKALLVRGTPDQIAIAARVIEEGQ